MCMVLFGVFLETKTSFKCVIMLGWLGHRGIGLTEFNAHRLKVLWIYRDKKHSRSKNGTCVQTDHGAFVQCMDERKRNGVDDFVSLFRIRIRVMVHASHCMYAGSPSSRSVGDYGITLRRSYDGFRRIKVWIIHVAQRGLGRFTVQDTIAQRGPLSVDLCVWTVGDIESVTQLNHVCHVGVCGSSWDHLNWS